MKLTDAFYNYLALTKPKTILLHIVTATSAMFLAARGVPELSKLGFTIAGGSLVAAASNTLNCYFDRDLDKLMPRTSKRPLPSGRLSPVRALVFGILAAVIGAYLFIRFVNVPAAVIALLALISYVLVYTIWLKRRTFWSTIAGSIAGAFPPLIGWVAINDSLAAAPFVLAGVIILWTPVHFWALAVYRQQEYSKAGVTALPRKNTTGWILFFSLLLAIATLLLIPFTDLSLAYGILASLLGLYLIYLSIRLKQNPSLKQARQLFLFSIWYLALVFVMAVASQFL